MPPGLSAFDILKNLGSFALVIALLLAVLWYLKKLQARSRLARDPEAQLELTDSLTIGPRQKIALVRVGERAILIGITAQQITALGEVSPPTGSPS